MKGANKLIYDTIFTDTKKADEIYTQLENLGLTAVKKIKRTLNPINTYNNKLYVIGRNDYHQLGIVNKINNINEMEYFRNREILAISCGENHTIIYTKDKKFELECQLENSEIKEKNLIEEVFLIGLFKSLLNLY